MLKRMRSFLVAAMLMVIATVSAQVTTSSMSGKVTAQDEPIIGATVVAIHEPSGTRYGTFLIGIFCGAAFNDELSSRFKDKFTPKRKGQPHAVKAWANIGRRRRHFYRHFYHFFSLVAFLLEDTIHGAFHEAVHLSDFENIRVAHRLFTQTA